jgi:pyrimidine-nucleoside phosphorylase
VKVGSGAFAQSLPEARALAALMVQIGARMGLPTVAVITDMSEPLGRAVGNALEVKEALSALRGRASEDLMEVTLTLTAYMLHLADALSAEQPPQRLSAHVLKRYKDECMDYIEHGDAFARLLRMVDAQGGDAEALLNPSLLPRAEHVEPVEAPEEGYLQALDAYWVGQAALLLGAGRDRIDASVDVAAGLILAAKPPDELKKGQPLAMLHTNDPALLGPAKEAFLEGVRIGQRPPAPRRLVHEVLLSPQG